MRRLRLATTLAGAATVVVLLRPLGDQLAGLSWSSAMDDPEHALLAAAQLTGWLLAGWLFLVTSLALVAASATAVGRYAAQLVRILTPVAARRLLEGALGMALVVVPSGVAGAATQPAPVPATAATLPPVPAPIVAPPEPRLPPIDRPAASATAVPPPSAPTPVEHRVLPGDTLWGIAADTLPTGAQPARIAALWQQWYAANLNEIGADPSLLLPGQVLLAPVATPAAR